MGGAIKTPGNVTRTAEFNIYSDPEAAKIVFECGIKNIILVPLDVTQKVIFPPELLKRIDYGNENKQHSLAGFIHDILDFYIQFCSNIAGYDGCPLHDPLAVGEAIDPSFMEKKAMDVRIVTKSQTFGMEKNDNNNPARELIRGQTVAELRKGINIKEARPNVNVCMDVDANRFLEYFTKTINS
jgi:purine nucleosidase